MARPEDFEQTKKLKVKVKVLKIIEQFKYLNFKNKTIQIKLHSYLAELLHL